MRAELPWNVAGIPPEAREAARAAARREGLSVGEWLTGDLRERMRNERTKPVTKAMKKAKARRAERRPFPYAEVARMWADGKTIAEIGKAIDRIGDGKDPYHSLRVVLTRMHRGYKDSHGKLVKLPHRVSQKTVRLSRKAGKKAVG